MYAEGSLVIFDTIDGVPQCTFTVPVAGRSGFGVHVFYFFFFQAEDGIRDHCVTGVQTCALPISSPSSGVNTVTGEGLGQALAGARVVVDVSNAPSWEDKAVLEFFETSGHNLLAAEAAAGVGHHVALSVVGTDRLLASGYFRAKMAQENLIKASSIPYTIVRSTQFFEFVSGIAQLATEGQTVRLPAAMMQPIVSDDGADVVVDLALAKPLNSTLELARPGRIRLDALGGQ